MSALHRLAARAGLQIDWHDATGRAQRTGDDALRQVLGALGFPAEDDSQVAQGLARCRDEIGRVRFLSADCGQPITLPPGLFSTGRAELELEDGTTRWVDLRQEGDGIQMGPVQEIGYHRLRASGAEIRLAVAPLACFGVDDLAPGARLWGPAIQVPSLRDGAQRAFGDFGSLADAASRFAAAGADALAISPAHALFPADPERFSPYGPSTRLFLNVLLADPALIGHPVPPAHAGELIDWAAAIPARMQALRAAFEASREALADRLMAYRAEAGGELEKHAVFDALYAHFFDSGARGWQGWPSEYHDPASGAVKRFAAEQRDEVEFYIFAQWLAKSGLDAAQRAAREAGMKIGLIADLAVGMDSGGSHAWSRPRDVLEGLSIGAPPDPLGPHGQDWGLTSFSPGALRRQGFDPLIATLRASLDHCGGIRIDHALGLNRLWVIPHGGAPGDGAYLTYPLLDMLRILAIESHRSRAVVIGEDLGTIPEGLRPKLEERQVLGMRVLWFERDHQGGFVPPGEWQRNAVAMTGTHDLPTVAGWWEGRDLDWAWELGRVSPDRLESADREHRAYERGQLWQAFHRSDAAKGEPPPPDQPQRAVDAATEHVASTPCALAIFPLEDIAGLTEQPNLPGTTSEHPNWRRRMPQTTVDLLGNAKIARRIERINERRST